MQNQPKDHFDPSGSTAEHIAEEFADQHEVIDWICANQLGRRNLTTGQRADLRGRRYNNEKQDVGAPEKNKNAQKQCDHNDPIVSTAEHIAEESQVSAPTVKRDAQFSDALDALEELGIERNEMTSGKRKVRKTHVLKLAELAKTDPQAALAAWHKVAEQSETSGAIKSAMRDMSPTPSG